MNNEQDEDKKPQNVEPNDDAPRGYKVEDAHNLEEKDLKRTYLFGSGKMADPDKQGYESHGAGGNNFGKTNVTTSGDDSANPSQNAGYSNDYFKRTEPSEEHPENNNFKPAHQEGAPMIDGIIGNTTDSNIYQEGTSDYDGGTQRDQPANANPEQNKVGDGDETEPGKSAYDKGKPQYGSNSPENQT